ncbi:MAG: hypothetical protein H7Y60_19080 [Rhodospirillaceae bacterium]|nr:hypothetical protein [Rhodospirillales bacterium]
MFGKKMTLSEILRERGIADAGEYLDARKDTPKASGSSLVELRGSVHLMLGRTITREEVNQRLDALRHA